MKARNFSILLNFQVEQAEEVEEEQRNNFYIVKIFEKVTAIFILFCFITKKFLLHIKAYLF